MDAKTIIAIVLVVFIGGAALWLNIRHRKNKRPIKCRNGGGRNMPPSFHIWRYPMRNLKTVEKKVRAILEKNEDARNDDMVLYLALCNVCLKDAGAIPLAEIMTQYKYLGLPSFESVSRTRRKLQAKHPELSGNARMQRLRATGEKAYRKYAKE